MEAAGRLGLQLRQPDREPPSLEDERNLLEIAHMCMAQYRHHMQKPADTMIQPHELSFHLVPVTKADLRRLVEAASTSPLRNMRGGDKTVVDDVVIPETRVCKWCLEVDLRGMSEISMGFLDAIRAVKGFHIQNMMLRAANPHMQLRIVVLSAGILYYHPGQVVAVISHAAIEPPRHLHYDTTTTPHQQQQQKGNGLGAGILSSINYWTGLFETRDVVMAHTHEEGEQQQQQNGHGKEEDDGELTVDRMNPAKRKRLE